MKYNDEGPSLTVNCALTHKELSREELEKDLWERIVILNEPRPIIETLKYEDRYKKVLDTILLDKLKLDGELELEEVDANKEMIREYKAIKEKEDPDVFVLSIRLEGRFVTHDLADTGSNINIIPYRIFKELGREHVKPVSHNVIMLNHFEAEPIGMLKDVLCQVGVTTELAKLLILNMPVDRTIPIIIGGVFSTPMGEL
ncbi:retrotransposon ORF1 [Tanacetum coccineum]